MVHSMERNTKKINILNIPNTIESVSLSLVQSPFKYLFGFSNGWPQWHQTSKHVENIVHLSLDSAEFS